tara:strand:- start:437 stop:1318 length:882 start_codon:yes stop_codon:yes gene_type:complete
MLVGNDEMLFYSRKLFYLLIFILLQACSSGGIAPVLSRDEIKDSPPNISKSGKNDEKKKPKSKAKAPKRIVKNKGDCYVVTRGDTLYSIAWRYNYDYKELANWNNIKPPYIIRLGKNICFKPIRDKQIKKLESQPDGIKFSEKKKIDQNRKAQADTATKEKKSSKNLPAGAIKWFWPTKGKIVRLNSPTSKKGLDISGLLGQSISAAAEGVIVYSGSGLVGYGKLIIIKHNEKFLSAYAYNSELLVKEGDTVKAGQKISKMGQDHAGRKILHFEIRQNGKPEDPLKYLPKNQG